jgi:hypothetical protein
VGPDPEGGPFMTVRIKPSADLDRVEEVLVITKVIDKSPEHLDTAKTLRAADILAQRLPTVAPKPPGLTGAEPPPTSVLYAKKPPSAVAGASTSATTPKTPKANPPAPGVASTNRASQPKPIVPQANALSSAVSSDTPQNVPTASAKPEQASPVALPSPGTETQPVTENPR